MKLSVCRTVTNGARESVVEPSSVLHVCGYGVYSMKVRMAGSAMTGERERGFVHLR